MTIEIIIRGNHTTDVLAELTQLSQALTKPVMVHTKEGQESTLFTADYTGQLYVEHVKETAQELGVEEQVLKSGVEENTNPETREPQKEEETSKRKPRKFGAERQIKEVEKMIDAGELDDEILERLNDDNVEKAKAGVAAKTTVIENDEEITVDIVRDLMSSMCRTGTDNDREMMVKVHKRLANFVPDGQNVKISNVPEDKLVELYRSVVALKGD